jgi:hypothetical protein
MTFFDEDALDSALDELDERYAAGEGVEHAYTIGRTSDLRHAVTAHDWAAVEALVADDFVFTDHRPIGLPGADRAGYLAAMTASAEQTPGTVMMGRALEIRGDVTLMRTRRVGATTEGLEYEWEQYAVNRWAAGLLRCVELFALEDESAARARFAGSAAQSMTPYLDNAQIRFIVCEQWRGQYADGDPLAILTEDCVLVDRRTSVNAGVITGGAEVSASIQSGIDVFGRLDLVPLATRGDRVGLYRWAFVQDGGFATPALTVITSAEDLRAARIESFDERDLADAVDLMEMRHAEIEGDSLTWTERIAAEGERTLNHRDFDGFGPLLAPGFTVVDHRRLGIPMDRDSYLESMRVLIEQAPDFTFFFAKLHIDGNVAITPVPFFGTTPEGNRYEWSYVQVAVGDPETGQALAFEFFDDDRWDDAVARFHELVAASRPATAPRDPRP